MKVSTFLALLFISSITRGDDFRIAEVKPLEGPDAERMTRVLDGKNEVVFVSKTSVITVADIESATVSPHQDHAISVKLKPEGAEKLRKATERMELGIDRLAIVIDEKIHSAPVVRGVLGGSFEISELHQFDARGLENLARRISGRPELKQDEAPARESK